MSQFKIFHQQLVKFFNESELQFLCAELGIDYENLSGQNKLEKAKELIFYHYRHQTLNILLDTVATERPHANWHQQINLTLLTQQLNQQSTNDTSSTDAPSEVNIYGGQVGQIINAQNIENIGGVTFDEPK